MVELGNLMMVVGCAAAAWAFAGGLAGAVMGYGRVSDSARRGVYLAAVASIVGSAALMVLLVRHDYSIAYVYKYTSNSLDALYSSAALWAGQEGSLLFWVSILGIYSTLALQAKKTRETGLVPHITWVLGSIQLFFFILLVTVADPFKTLVAEFPEAAGVIVREGSGLNPQLQNYWMLIHPPMLYLGYVGLSIPFAFSIAALATGRLDPQWIRASRVWTMTCWTFLGFGILLGGRWAYVELGWGGYWAWDPVENASLMPWLTATAFIHSVIIEEQRGMLRRWNIFLILITFLLSIFGTFLTRSGLISSVHSFAQSGVGDVFLYFMGAWALTSLTFFVYRYEDLAPKRPFESVFSRESAFLFQNLFLVAICAAVLWGTMYPVFSEFFYGEQITVRAPYFNRAIVPVGLGLFFLIGAGPMIPWRAASWPSLAKNLGPSALLAALVGTGTYLFIAPILTVALAFGISIFIIGSTFTDVGVVALARHRSTGENLLTAFMNLIEKKRRRYGGYLAHVGMGILLFGMAGTAFNVEREKYLMPGDSLELGQYRVEYRGHESDNDGHRDFYNATVDLYHEEKIVGTLFPEISVYFPGTEREIRNSEVAIHSTISEDVYLVFAQPEGENALIRIMINPLIFLFWTGGLVVVAGALVALLPWKFPRAGAVALFVATILTFAATPADAEYGHALGNRDPVSANFLCQCGCNLVLEQCDHPNCGSAGPLLDEIAASRRSGADDPAVIEAMVRAYGDRILNAPPGHHLMVWAAPIVLLVSGGIFVAIYLMRNRRRIGAVPVESAPEVSASAVEAALAERKKRGDA